MGWTILPLATSRTEQNRTRMEQLEKKKQEQNDWKKRNKKRMIGKKGTRTEWFLKKGTRTEWFLKKGTRTEQSTWTEQIQKSQRVPSPSCGKDSIPLDKKKQK